MSENTNEKDEFEEEETNEQSEDDSLAESGPVETDDKREIDAIPSDPEVNSLYRQWTKGRLKTQPDFQRREVWSNKQKSKLIESAILKVPLPSVYVSEDKDDIKTVIDGQQRLMAFFHFMRGEFSLSGLITCRDLNGLKYEQMSEKNQEKISTCPLRVIKFNKNSDENLKFEIFQRLNSGAISLSEQEMRNCVYRGKYNNLLIELSKDPKFRKIMGMPKSPHERMKDVEYVLRFAAFYFETYKHYEYPMKEFMSKEMKKRQDISKKDEKKLKTAFKNTVNLIHTVFGESAFRRWFLDENVNKSELPKVKRHNMFSASLFDILMGCFAHKDKRTIVPNSDAIREAIIALSTQSKDFTNYLTKSTSATPVVKKRFELWDQELNAILKHETPQPRCFSRKLKKELFEKDPTCKICNNRISDIDDAAVDHIEQYWRGGKTIPENARLTHHHCNNTRSRKE